jgi:quercetin dioxygenase-like cupin family protein
MAEGRQLEAVLAIFGPGGKSGKHPHVQAREEFAYVVKGRVTLTLADEENELSAGDAVAIPAQAPRLWENRTGEVAEIVMVASRGK